jgi:hypothetical protein
MLKIQRGDGELDKLVNELSSLSTKTNKTAAIDDLIDALRYASMAVPWDFSFAEMTAEDKKKIGVTKDEEPRLLTESERRKEWFLNSKQKPAENTVELELDEWNSLFAGSSSE